MLTAAAPHDADLGSDLEARLTKARLRAQVAGERSEVSVSFGRFEVVRCLGRGGMGKVFEARDRVHGARLALKLLHDAQADAVARLRREFRALSHVSHPNLVAMYELHLECGVPFIAMELVDGVSLQRYVQGPAMLQLDFVIGCLRQLAEALHALHAGAIVHGDIKPSNVLLRPDGTLVVIDFGLARALGGPSPSTGSGTPAYMAPERSQAARAEPSADFWAVGAILRDLLERVDKAARRREPTRLSTLQTLCSDLLDPNPKTRAGTHRLSSCLGLAGPPPPWLVPFEDDVFVARDAELARLSRALELSAFEPVVCTVRADPGMGKTTLVERFVAAQAQARAGTIVLRARCFESEVLPYSGMDGLIEALAGCLSDAAVQLRDVLDPVATAALLQVFPGLDANTLGAVPAAVSTTASDDPLRLRRAAYDALASLLCHLAQRSALILFIDDLQWGDADAAALLAHLLTGPRRAAFLLIACQRLDEVGPCDAVIRSAAARSGCGDDITLAALDEPACAELTQRVLGRTLPKSACARLSRESSGNPLLLRALLRAGPAQPASPATARTFQELIAQALDQLEAPERELLLCTALAGRPLGVALLKEAAQLAEHPWKSVAILRGARLVRTLVRDTEPLLLPHHDRVRDAVVSVLPDEERRVRHARLANAALTLSFDDSEFLSDQFARAGALAEAAVQAERAGDRALEAMALSRARDLYARALQWRAPARPLPLITKLAEAAAAIGDVERASALFMEASAARPAAASELRLRAAEMCLLRGAEAQAMQLLRPALRKAGVWLPEGTWGTLLLGTGGLVRTYLLAGRDGVAHAKTRPDAQPDAQSEIGFRVGYMLAQLSPRGFALLLWSGARALKHGSAAQRGRALAVAAHAYAVVGLRTEDVQDTMLQRASALTSNDAVAHAHVLCCHALLHFARSDCREALDALERAQRFIADERVGGAHWLLGPLHAIMASVCVMSGEFTRLDAFAAGVERDAQLMGNRPILTQIRSARAWARLARGDPDALRRYADATLDEWAGPQLSPLYGLGVWGQCHRLLYDGEPHAARALMQAESRRFQRSGLMRIQPWAVSLGHVHACVELSCSKRPGDARFRAAELWARRLDAQPARWAVACAALLRGGFARRRGERETALAAYAVAAEGFKRSGMRGYAAAAAYRSAELRCEPQTETWFAEQSIAEPARWVRMYAP